MTADLQQVRLTCYKSLLSFLLPLPPSDSRINPSRSVNVQYTEVNSRINPIPISQRTVHSSLQSINPLPIGQVTVQSLTVALTLSRSVNVQYTEVNSPLTPLPIGQVTVYGSQTLILLWHLYWF